MSDGENGKKSGYRLEYASSSRAKCNGPKPCKGTSIGKGELRFGSLVDFRGNTSFSWRHWGCVTSKIISNMKNTINEAEDLDGFEDLNEDDQEKIRRALEEGKVADEDIPESARKPDGTEDEEEDDDDEKPKAKKGSKKKADDKNGDGGKGVFKLDYASSARSKCKNCGEGVGKGFFRLGQEADFRGHKAMHWHHFGCATPKQIASLKASYDAPTEIDGFGELKSAEQEKVKRVWEAGEVPDEDKGAGEAVETAKKVPVKRKKDQDGEEKPKRGRAKKAKEEDSDDEKPKRKRAAPAEKKGKAPAKKNKKKATSDDESGEDFGDQIAAVGDDEEEDEEEEEPAPKKRKTAPSSKGKPASKAKPTSKAKPASARGRKKAQESDIDEEDD